MEINENILKDFTKKRQRGIYYTPNKTAEFMVSLIRNNINEHSVILDPCVGEGIFIEKLLKSGIKPSQIIAQDIVMMLLLAIHLIKVVVIMIISKFIKTNCRDYMVI